MICLWFLIEVKSHDGRLFPNLGKLERREMYCVNKMVEWLSSPLGMLYLGCLLGVALRMRARGALKRVGTGVVVGSFVLLWMFSCHVTTRFLGVPLEGEEAPLVDTLEMGGCDAIVLLGGGMGAHESCGRAEMLSGADRVWEAARQWKAHHDGRLKLTLSGHGVERSTVPLLKDLGVDEKAFVFFPDARNTEEEARMIAAAGFSRVRLVTSAWHMPRARRLFERAGIEVRVAPTDYEMHYMAELPLGISDFFPRADALARNSAAAKEWVARFCYWLRDACLGTANCDRHGRIH